MMMPLNPIGRIKRVRVWVLIILLFFCLWSLPSNFSSTNIPIEFAIIGKVSAQSWQDTSAGLPTVGEYYGVCFGDIDNDSNLDIAFGSCNLGVRVYRGDGTGNWVSASAGLPITGQYNGVWLGDINNDNYDDLVVALQAKGVRVYTSDGAGSWTNSSTGLPTTGEYHGVCFGDINNDGNLDVLAASAGYGVRVYTGNGAGSWTNASAGLPTTGWWNGIHCGYMNNDAYLDLVVASFDGVRVYTGNGAGSWTNASDGLPGGGDEWMGVYCGDINNDNYDDVAATVHGGSNPIKVWTSDGIGTWADASTGLPSGGFLDVVSVWLGDINLDGNLDVVFPLTNSGLRVYAGNGAGVWTNITSSELPLSGQPVGVCLGDINNNGTLDIGCTWNGDGVRVYSTWNVTATYTLELQKGWNFITLPLNTTYERAEDLAQAINNCTHIAKWNTTTSSFELHEKGTNANNFTINDGEGYFIYVNASSSFEITGTVISSVEMSLTVGWNSIGRFNSTTIYASDLAASIGSNCTAIAYWNNTLGRFITHPKGTDISNFAIERGNGYLVYVTSDETWTNK